MGIFSFTRAKTFQMNRHMPSSGPEFRIRRIRIARRRRPYDTGRSRPSGKRAAPQSMCCPPNPSQCFLRAHGAFAVQFPTSMERNHREDARDAKGNQPQGPRRLSFQFLLHSTLGRRRVHLIGPSSPQRNFPYNASQPIMGVSTAWSLRRAECHQMAMARAATGGRSRLEARVTRAGAISFVAGWVSLALPCVVGNHHPPAPEGALTLLNVALGMSATFGMATGRRWTVWANAIFSFLWLGMVIPGLAGDSDTLSMALALVGALYVTMFLCLVIAPAKAALFTTVLGAAVGFLLFWAMNRVAEVLARGPPPIESSSSLREPRTRCFQDLPSATSSIPWAFATASGPRKSQPGPCASRCSAIHSPAAWAFTSATRSRANWNKSRRATLGRMRPESRS